MSDCCSPNSITVPCKGIGLTFQLGEIGCGSGNGSGSNDLSDIEKRLEELEKKQQSGSTSFSLCEFYYFRNPKMPKGFEPAQGGIVEHANDFYPEAWAFLQTDEGKALCVTEEEWQAMTKAVYYTAMSKDENDEDVIKEFSFNGIGGAPFYVQDMNAGTLRLPDIRGMYAEASGFDGLGVGSVHGDGIPPITGKLGRTAIDNDKQTGGVFTQTSVMSDNLNSSTGGLAPTFVTNLDSSRVIPSTKAVRPRAWGANACVYLGTSITNKE